MKNKLVLIFSGFFAGICNGLFGSGGGMIVVPVLSRAGLSAHKAHATAIAVILPLALSSIVRYASFASIPAGTLLPVCIGGSVGAFAGAKFLRRFSGKALNRIFGVLIIATAVRMVVV